MNNSLVISADCHAGLPNEQYREWMDPAFRDTFDEYQAARAGENSGRIDLELLDLKIRDLGGTPPANAEES